MKPITITNRHVIHIAIGHKKELVHYEIVKHIIALNPDLFKNNPQDNPDDYNKIYVHINRHVLKTYEHIRKMNNTKQKEDAFEKFYSLPYIPPIPRKMLQSQSSQVFTSRKRKVSQDESHPDFVPSLNLGYDIFENTSKRTKTGRYLKATKRSSDTKSVERENENDGDTLETILSILKSSLQSLNSSLNRYTVTVTRVDTKKPSRSSKNNSSESKVSHQPSETMNQSVTPKKIIGPKKQALVFSEHLCKLVSSLALLWKNGKLCDAGIGNGTSVVVVHKVVLIALSPKLMSTVNVNASHFLLVTVKKSVSYSALVAFAEYMYKGVLDLDPDILSQLRLIALQLEMKELEQLCVDHLDINSLDTNKTFATDSPTHQQDPKSLPIILQLPMKTVSSGSHETAATLTQTLDTNSHDTNKTFATDSPTHQQDPKSLPIIPQIPTKTVSSGSHETAATLTQTLDAKKRHSSHNLTVESPLSPLKKNKEVDSDESSQVSSARFGKHYVITQCTKTNEKSLLDIETEPMLFDMATYSQHPLSPSERCAKSSRDFHQPKDYSNSSRAASLDPDEITAPSISVLLKGTTSNSTSLNDITDCEEYIQRPYPVGLFKSRGLGMPLEVSSKEVEMTPMQICQSFTDITDSEEHIQKPYPMGLFKAKESGMLLEVSSKENEMTFMQITDIHSVPPTRDKFLTKSSDIDLRENINIPHLFSVDGNSMKNWNK